MAGNIETILEPAQKIVSKIEAFNWPDLQRTSCLPLGLTAFQLSDFPVPPAFATKFMV
jgi:hypothetical protein